MRLPQTNLSQTGIRSLTQQACSKGVGVLAALAVAVTAVVLISSRSVISYFYFMTITVLLYTVLFRKVSAEPMLLYALYSMLTIALYLLQFISLPEYFGFTGGFGIGTDDHFFYSQVAARLPAGFLTRPNYLANISNYSTVLRFVTPFAVLHPLDILFFNVIPLVFIPVLVRLVTFAVTHSSKAARVSFLVAAICPFTMSNGLVLVRDGWTAALFIGAIYCYLARRHFCLIGIVLCLFYIRIGSGVALLSTLAVLVIVAQVALRKSRGHASVWWVVLGIAVIMAFGGVFGGPIIANLRGKGIALSWTGLLFRESFVTGFLGSGDSTLYRISQTPFFERIPLTFLYFLIAPFLSLRSLVLDGVFIPRNVLTNVLYPVVFLVYLKWGVQGLFAALRKRNTGVFLLYVAFGGLLLGLSQASLQVRHKTMIMPLMYVLVGYGAANRTRMGRLFGGMATVGVGLAELIFLVIRR
jgi:hypothetical protein